MSLVPQCLQDAVGLANHECPCFSGNTYANTSQSGLYISELIDMRLFEEGCQQGGVWEQLDNARSTAINRVNQDILSCIMVKKKHKLVRTPFSGVIGDAQKFSQFVNSKGTYQGLTIVPANVQGGYMYLNRIGLFLSNTSTYDVYLYSNYQDTPIAGWQVGSTANKLEWTTVNLSTKLPLSYPGFSYVRYWVVYEPSGAQHKDTKIDCGCDNIMPPWSLLSPSYPRHTRFLWNEWVMARGTYGESLTNMDDWQVVEQNMATFVDVSFMCATDEIICKDELNFNTNYLAISIALAIQYKAAQTALYNYLTFGGGQALFNAEQLYMKMQAYANQYQEKIDYLCEQISSPEMLNKNNDCLSCYNEDSFILGGIMS